MLSIEYVSEGNTTVALPTFKNADGSICKSYLASAGPQNDRFVDTSVKQICGPANEEGTAPANLLAMKNYSANGLVIQLPTVKVDVKQ